MQIFRSYKKTSVHVVCKFPSFIFMLGEPQSPEPALASKSTTVFPTERTCLRAVTEDTGRVRKLPGKQTDRFALVWMPCSLSKVSPGDPLYRESCKCMALAAGRYPSLDLYLQLRSTQEHSLSIKIKEFSDTLDSFRYSSV